MSNYRIMIERITDILCKSHPTKKNYILVGDNSSGKSEILRSVVEKQLSEEIYFIDSVNRTFDCNKVELESQSYKNIKLTSKDVVLDRINPFNFNLQDTFHAAPCIEQLFGKYRTRIRTMCQLFLNQDFDIIRTFLEAGLVENKVLLNGIETKLSSGYQAIIRLFCEILFFCDVLQAEKCENGFIVIDEIDEYLSPKYCARIFNFLQEQFPELHFLVTTHSSDIVEYSKNADLIILHGWTYDIYTCQELENNISVSDIFTNLFFSEDMIHKSDNSLLDEKLRLLLNIKIAGLWDKKAEDDLHEIIYEDMQPHQKMIYKQIEEW